MALARFSTPDPATCSPRARRPTAAPEPGELDLLRSRGARAVAREEDRDGRSSSSAWRWRTTRASRAPTARQVSTRAAARARSPTRNGAGARAWDGTSVSAWVVRARRRSRRRAADRRATAVSQALACRDAGRPRRSRPRPHAARWRASARARVPTARVPVMMHPDIAAAWLSEMYDALQRRSRCSSSRRGSPTGSVRPSPRRWSRWWTTDACARGIGLGPWDGEGVPTRRNVLIDRGRLRDVRLRHLPRAPRRRRARPATRCARYASHARASATTTSTSSPARETPEADPRPRGSRLLHGRPGLVRLQQRHRRLLVSRRRASGSRTARRRYPVDGVTVASNSLDMLKSVAAVGNDLRFDGSVACPDAADRRNDGERQLGRGREPITALTRSLLAATYPADTTHSLLRRRLVLGSRPRPRSF